MIRIVYRLKQSRLCAYVPKMMLVLAALSIAAPASAQRSPDPGLSRTPNVPVLAVVALRSQKITVYSARGKMLEAPVSTGRSGYETPAGIYAILQKRRDHYSNLYNDASMPFMQRITWSGIALHAGDLPGYPASHGCIRMPYDFAGQLFGLTKRGMRVVVTRDDMSPVDFAHPALFTPGPVQLPPGDNGTPENVHLSASPVGAQVETADKAPPLTRRALVAAKEAEAIAAARKADEVRRANAPIEREAAAFEDALDEPESEKRTALARIEEADLLVASSPSLEQELKGIKARAQARLAVAQAQIDAIYAKGKEKLDAARAARAEVRAAEAAKVAALNEAVKAAGTPVSVFISRKSQRLYVRRSFQPIFDAEVTIQKPNAPLGTIIFTAVNWSDDDTGLRWTALSMYPQGSSRHRDGEGIRTNADAAKAALERVSISQEAMDRINELVTPGSSLIISDEALSSKETGEATDFVVLMSGERQGGVSRRRVQPVEPDDDGPFSPGGFMSLISSGW